MSANPYGSGFQIELLMNKDGSGNGMDGRGKVGEAYLSMLETVCCCVNGG